MKRYGRPLKWRVFVRVIFAIEKQVHVYWTLQKRGENEFRMAYPHARVRERASPNMHTLGIDVCLGKHTFLFTCINDRVQSTCNLIQLS